MRYILFVWGLILFNSGLKANFPGYYRGSPYSRAHQFFIGVKGGINFTQPLILTKFNVINPLNEAVSNSGIKTYKNLFHNFGYQYAFTVVYQFAKSIDIRFEPTFTTYCYKYTTEFSWVSSGANMERIDMNFAHNQTLKYFEIPITLRYLIGSGTLRPFLQGGIFYSFLQNALKTTNREETYTNALGYSALNAESLSGNAGPLYKKSRYGFNAGVGIDYDLTLFHLTLDANINTGLNTITSEAGRYGTQQYSGGMYDAQDDLKLLILSVNLGILFPLNKPAKSKMKCTTK
jgi:hypothetical protein